MCTLPSIFNVSMYKWVRGRRLAGRDIEIRWEVGESRAGNGGEEERRE